MGWRRGRLNFRPQTCSRGSDDQVSVDHSAGAQLRPPETTGWRKGETSILARVSWWCQRNTEPGEEDCGRPQSLLSMKHCARGEEVIPGTRVQEPQTGEGVAWGWRERQAVVGGRASQTWVRNHRDSYGERKREKESASKLIFCTPGSITPTQAGSLRKDALVHAFTGGSSS